MSLAGFMKTANGWLPTQQRVNFAPDELDALIDAVRRAKLFLDGRGP